MILANEEGKVIRVLNAVATGVTAQYSTALDMSPFDEAIFYVMFGTIADGTPTVKLQESVDAAFTSPLDIEGSSISVTPTTHNNKVAVLNIARPLKRYVRVAIVRSGTTGQVIDGVLAVQYSGTGPVTHDTSVLGAKMFGNPKEGTA